MLKSRESLDLTPIKGLLALIRESWQPRSIWLFGSRARGEEHAESDWDLLVIIPDDRAAPILNDPMAAWKLKGGKGYKADLIPCSLEEFNAGAEVPNTLAFEVAHNGIMIYEQERGHRELSKNRIG